MTKEEEMLAAMKEMATLSGRVSELWNQIDIQANPDFSYLLICKYPFKESFSDIHHKLINWTNNIEEKLNSQ